ncbi:Cell division control protein 45 [Folsomia candida]|uniref:Cell division control protein 45 n=1 Tax=Folsomia candida TaxID=158441 RepID=A0A226F2W8_FOLCA|nr:Cell division control protein 45 [Folsomia candida]
MLVKHLRKEFYELLFGKRVLIIANSDIDSVCTVKIFTELLKIDGISFSLCPVDGITDMKQAYSDYCETVNVFVLINCGISLDIRDFFDNLNNKLVFVLDCHRPVHVNNFYDETNQIRILSLDGNFDEVPNFDDLFWSGEALDSDDDGNDDDSDILDKGESDDEDGSQRRGRNPKRRRNEHDKERRQMIWKQKRNELLFKYTQFGYYAPPSSLVALELSWAISRGDIQYVWWTTVALTDAFLLEKLPRSDLHIAREASSTETPRDCLKVNFEKDLCFLLYRHWNLYDSIKMTTHSACMLKSWGMKGEGRFHEMLGELGLPQLECHQKYTSMDVRLRKKVKNVFNEPVLREKYNFQDVTVGTFISEIGFRPALSEFDCENTGARKGRSRHELLQLPGSFPVRVWYSEIARHSWTTNYYQTNSGHFTQVVWNATKRVGCGRVVTEKLCREGKLKLEPIYIVVCRYSPPGNWLHKQAYKDHVHPPKVGKPNQIPDFTKFCPQDSKPCSKPIVCCTDANTMKDHTENINCSSLSSTTSQSSALNHQLGRSFVFSGTKTTSTLRPDYVSKSYLGRSVMSASYHKGLPWPLWHDKRGRNIRQ